MFGARSALQTEGEQSGTAGSSLTDEQQGNLAALRLLLTFRNQPVSTSALVPFLEGISNNVPESSENPPRFSLDGELWHKTGAKLREAAIIETERLLNFYLVGTKSRKGLNAFDKEQFLPTIPRRPPCRPPSVQKAAQLRIPPAAPTAPPPADRRNRNPHSHPPPTPRCCPRLRPRRSSRSRRAAL